MPAHPATCCSCGQPLSRALADPQGRWPACGNRWCGGQARPLSAIYAVGTYSGSLRRAVRSYKFSGEQAWARPFARLLASFLARHYCWFEEFAVVCPVPSHPGDGPRCQHLERVCHELRPLAAPDWPVEELLEKRVPTYPMRHLDLGQRTASGRGRLCQALRVPDPDEVRGRRIILLDDVVASGSTLLAGAQVLRQAGADEVVGLALARASWSAPLHPAPEPRHSRGALEPGS